ncbi:MAG: TROVE domain-containing protein [Devosia sp.]
MRFNRVPNVARPAPLPLTHGGAIAVPLTPEQKLRRSVLSCLLWEDEFYEDGQAIAERIAYLAAGCSPQFVADLAREARQVHGLRHAPLLLVLDLIRRGGPGVADAVDAVIGRADEMAELVALYWRNGRKPLSKQMKAGLARAFGRFDAYQLAKYDRAGPIRLRDVMFLVHPRPRDAAQAELFRQVAERSLPVPDTWEVALSAGGDRKAVFERLIAEEKLGYLALLRNLRAMAEAGCDRKLVSDAIIARKGADLVFPFRYVAAARRAPVFEPALDEAFLAATREGPRLPGTTLLIVDVSGSMYGPRVSQRSDITRALAASALGAIARSLCEDVLIYATAGSDPLRQHKTQIVPARQGMALVDAIYKSMVPLGGGGIFLNQVMRFLRQRHPEVDRVIVITDEQDCGVGAADAPQNAPAYGTRANYLINVASARNGIGYERSGWTHIDGFSEAVLRYILALEDVAGR